LSQGYDTISSVVQSVFLRIGCHLEVQKKMQVEIDEVFGSEEEKSLTWNDLRRLEYTGMVIEETMRLHPALPLVMRHLDDPLVLGNSYITGENNKK